MAVRSFLCCDVILMVVAVDTKATRWRATSWTAVCPAETLMSWAALRTATCTAGTWWRWVGAHPPPVLHMITYCSDLWHIKLFIFSLYFQGSLSLKLPVGKAVVQSLSFHPSQTRLLTAMEGRVQVWSAEPEEAEEEAPLSWQNVMNVPRLLRRFK